MIAKHDLSESISAAILDESVGELLLKHKFETTRLISPEDQSIAAASQNVINMCIELGRVRYSNSPERLCAVISASATANALAIWGQRDWVVVSQGLMEALHGASEKVALALKEEVLLGTSNLGQILLATPSPSPLFTSSVSWLIYAGALAFFVGHEIGHHLEGHDGVLTDRRLDNSQERSIVSPMERQALEVGADERGEIICRQVLTHYLCMFVQFESFTDIQKAEYQVTLALLLSTGLFLTLSVLQPRSVDLGDYSNSSHPPGTVRALLLSVHLSEKIKEHFKLIPEKIRRQIRLVSMDISCEASIAAGSPPSRLLRERAGKPEPVATRAMGLRRAMFDPDLESYVKELFNLRIQLRPRLLPREQMPHSKAS